MTADEVGDDLVLLGIVPCKPIKSSAEAARELLDSPRFVFFRDYLSHAKDSIVDLF